MRDFLLRSSRMGTEESHLLKRARRHETDVLRHTESRRARLCHGHLVRPFETANSA